MSVKIRLKRMGKIRTPFYRIVVADARTKRDGRVIEEIGTYNPKTDPSLIRVDSDRAQHWLGVGAQPSEPVLALFRKTGDWQKFKGEPAPPPLLEAAPKKDKAETFNEVLKEVHGDSASEAVTAKKTSRKPAKTTDAAAGPKTTQQAAPADEPVPDDEPAPIASPEATAADAAPDEAAAAAGSEAATPSDSDAPEGDAGSTDSTGATATAGPADDDAAPAKPVEG